MLKTLYAEQEKRHRFIDTCIFNMSLYLRVRGFNDTFLSIGILRY